MAKELNDLAFRGEKNRKTLKHNVRSDESHVVVAEGILNKSTARYEVLVQEHRKALLASQEGLRVKRQQYGVRKSLMQVVFDRFQLNPVNCSRSRMSSEIDGGGKRYAEQTS
jgi:hypothetical protein